MVARVLVLLAGLVLFCYMRSATADVPTPTNWPIRFHALLVQKFSGELAVMDLWYDWGKGGNLHIIQEQLVSPSYDMEWNNGTSFFWDEEAETCRTQTFGVGILRPNWLQDADFLGVKEMSGFTCNVFNKLDFITYYEDVVTGKPVYWKFFTEREVHVITFEEGVELNHDDWQAPDYCFSDDQTAIPGKNSSQSNKSSFLRNTNEWLLSRAATA